MRAVDFYQEDAVFAALVGAVLILGAWAGLLFVALSGVSHNLGTVGLMLLGFLGFNALGAAFFNTWRTPRLTIRSDAIVVPTLFGSREIPITPDHPVGEFLGPIKDTITHPRHRPHSKFESEWHVQFYALDTTGAPINLMNLHRDMPRVFLVRRALEDVAGLTVETLRRDPSSEWPRPDVRHWTKNHESRAFS